MSKNKNRQQQPQQRQQPQPPVAQPPAAAPTMPTDVPEQPPAPPASIQPPSGAPEQNQVADSAATGTTEEAPAADTPAPDGGQEPQTDGVDSEGDRQDEESAPGATPPAPQPPAAPPPMYPGADVSPGSVHLPPAEHHARDLTSETPDKPPYVGACIGGNPNEHLPPPAPARVKMVRGICHTKCYLGGKRYKPGDPGTFAGELPEHFGPAK